MTEPKKIADHIAKKLYGMTIRGALLKGICLHCGEQAIQNCYSEAGRKEYRISGLCEYCFDSITAEEDD